MTNRSDQRHFFLTFAQLNAPVALIGAEDLIPLVKTVLPKWPFEVTNAHDMPPCFTVLKQKPNQYLCYAGDHEEEASRWDALNSVCDLIAELAWEQIRSNDFPLYLHCSAVNMGGRLVLFPSGRRTGKSTLTACLAARGHQIFTDDFLPIEVDAQRQILGRANGVLPRIRLPLPQDFSSFFLDWINNNPGPENGQYQYLEVENLASSGSRLPIGAVVVLDRERGHTGEITEISRSKAVDGMILQNFDRSVHSSVILTSAAAISETANLYQLSYRSAEEAAAILENNFTTWHLPSRTLERQLWPTYRAADLEDDSSAPKLFEAEASYRRADGVTEVRLDEIDYLADEAGRCIHKLNAGSMAIWALVADPINIAKIVDVMHAALPDLTRHQIEQDSKSALQEFLANRLVISHEKSSP